MLDELEGCDFREENTVPIELTIGVAKGISTIPLRPLLQRDEVLSDCWEDLKLCTDSKLSRAGNSGKQPRSLDRGTERAEDRISLEGEGQNPSSISDPRQGVEKDRIADARLCLARHGPSRNILNSNRDSSNDLLSRSGVWGVKPEH